MVVSIDELSEYGRFYSDLEEHTKWWFCTTDYKVYETEEIIAQFSYENQEMIAASDTFLPLFRTDIIALEKEFLEEFAYEGDFVCEDSSNFDLSFKIYIEDFLEREWYAFESDRLCKDAVKWCKENGIPYRITAKTRSCKYVQKRKLSED